MHELGMCQAILDVVEKRAGDRPVARVRVRVGQLHHVHPEAFEGKKKIAQKRKITKVITKNKKDG